MTGGGVGSFCLWSVAVGNPFLILIVLKTLMSSSAPKHFLTLQVKLEFTVILLVCSPLLLRNSSRFFTLKVTALSTDAQ